MIFVFLAPIIEFLPQFGNFALFDFSAYQVMDQALVMMRFVIFPRFSLRYVLLYSI